jgi:hypothetical protein
MVYQLGTTYHLSIREGINFLKLGTSRFLVLGQFGLPDLSRDTGYGIKDFYDDRRLQIEYTYEGICESILVSPPSSLVYSGVDLLSLTWEQALDFARKSDPDVEIDDDGEGFTSHSIQIGMSAKLMDDWMVEAVLIFAKDYWPSQEEKRVVSERMLTEDTTTDEEAEAYLQALMNQEFNAEME